jgi:hypothetical protein
MAVDASTPIASGRAATPVTSAIRSAANATGTSFSYLLATAKIESDLDPSLTMKSSSAAGLFQFIDQTWLGTLKQAGPAFGYGAYADAITRNAAGHYAVDDPEMRKEIMKLRQDPTANSVMAGVLTQKNAAALIRKIGRQPTDSELYIAHFLGAGGAGKLIEAATSNPQANAADAFPLAAHANRPIFYDRQGNARSISGVYSEIVRRFKAAGDSVGATMMASAAPHPSAQAARPISAVTDVAATTKVFAAASVPRVPAAAAIGASPTSISPASVSPAAPLRPAASPTPPTFNSLFRDQDRRTAIDPLVVSLWSVPASAPQPNGAQAAAPVDNQANSSTGGARFNLFQDSRPNAGALFGGSS